MNIPMRREGSTESNGENRKRGMGSFYLWLKTVEWEKVWMIWAFFLPAMIMLVLFILDGIFPFGDRSFVVSDMYHQYVPFFSEFMRKIKEGEGLSYSWNVGMGSNFLALYVYYLASPLHWLAFLFPQKYLMEFMSYLVIIKMGLCGLTSTIYLRARYKTKEFPILLFSCFYAISGFMTAYNWNIMWLDCVVLAPLVLLGLERLVKEGKCRLYIITLSLSIFTNYYISIMLCIFLVLYFLVLLLTEKRSLKILWNFAWCSLLAGGLAAILLVPEVCAILETDFGDMNFPKKLESYFSVLDMLARHCMCIGTERGLQHWPNIYCGTIVFLLLPIFVLNQRISMRKRFGYLAVAGVMLLGFGTNMLDFIWHGMNYPDSLPARQSFLYILLVLVMCYEAFREIDGIGEKHILYGYLAAVVALLCSEKFVDSKHFDTGVEILNLGFVTAYAVVLYLYRTRKTLKWQKALAGVALVLVVAEVGINYYNTNVGTTSRSAYLGQLGDYETLAAQAVQLEEEAGEEGESFFRFEKFTRKTKNDGTLVGYPTASTFSSTMNSYVADLYKRWGMHYSKVYYGYDGATAFTSALLNVKYMFGENGEEGGYLYEQLGNSGDVWLYGCNASLPFGYVAPIGYDLPDGYSNEALRLQNRMVSELGIKGELFRKVSAALSGESVKFKAEQGGYYYALLTDSGTRKIETTGACERSFNDLKNGAVLYLGWLEQGETVTLQNGTEDDNTPKIKLDVYAMDTTVLERVLQSLSENHMEQVVVDNTHISGEIVLEEAGRLILSVPYEEGWKVELNGSEVVPELFGGTLMALDLELGQYTLELNYVPKGKYAGILITAFCVFISIAVMIKKWYGRSKKLEDFPV